MRERVEGRGRKERVEGRGQEREGRERGGGKRGRMKAVIVHNSKHQIYFISYRSNPLRK